MAKRKPLDLVTLQTTAQDYAREAFRNTPLHLTGIPEADFDKTAHAIVQALVSAWAAGFQAGRES